MNYSSSVSDRDAWRSIARLGPPFFRNLLRRPAVPRLLAAAGRSPAE